MPISAPSWTDFLICPICTNEFDINIRAPITLACGHTICKNCLATLHRKQCPFDQANITKDLDNLPINYALLQLTSSSSNNPIEHEILPSIIQSLTPQDLQYYKNATRCIEELALYLKPSSHISALLSRPMQRKLVALINCQLIDDEGRSRSLRAVRSLGERTITELILQHQNPQLLSTHLWAAVRARGCQFLGPAMQEEVLKLVLLALEDGSSLSRKVLVLYVVSQLVTTFPQASKTSIGHVVQLLYRASCFKVSKRESDSSLMTLKEEFRTYDALRREHDAQIVQIATEAGLRIAPDQWSALLYGDNLHKSHMQSIIDKQQNPSSFALSVHELLLALQRTGDPANLSRLRNHMDNLANIDASAESSTVPTWLECSNALDSVKQVVNGLIDFIQHHGNRKTQENSYLQNTSRYKVSFCRELQNHGNCARGQNCNFAHSDEEMERYRAKYKKNTMRNSSSVIPVSSAAAAAYNNQLMKESNNNSNIVNNHGSLNSSNSNNASSNGPNNQKVNMNHHSTFAKNNTNNNSSHHTQHMNSSSPSMRFNKSMSYRSEHSLHHHPAAAITTAPNHHQHHHHNIHGNSSSSNNHLKPANVYSSSTSTPNLSLPLSPNQQKIHSPNGPRFAFNSNGGNSAIYNSPSNSGNYPSNNFIDSPSQNLQPGKFINHHRPPLSAPPIPQQHQQHPHPYGKSPDYKKQLSPYHHQNQQHHHVNSHGNMTYNMSPTHVNNSHYGSGAMKTPPMNNNKNGNNSNSPVGYYGMQQTPTTHFFNNQFHPYSSSNEECNTSSSSSASFGGADQPKFSSWNRIHDKQSKSPNNLMPKSPTLHNFNKANTSPINRYDVVSQNNHDFNKQQQQRNVNHMNIAAQTSFPFQPKSNNQNNSVNNSNNNNGGIGNGDEIDGLSNVWNYQQFNPQQPAQTQQMMKNSAVYPFNSTGSSNTTTTISGKDKFIRSDSILTANTDDSYDNLPTNGKYGAIGLKSTSDMSFFKANQWSGLQQTVLNNLDNTFDIASAVVGGNSCESFKTIDLARSIDSKKSDDAHMNLNIGGTSNQNSQHRLNGNFLDMTIADINIPATSSNNDFWSNDSLQNWHGNESTENSKKKVDVDSLGNDMWNLKVWDFINE